MLECIKCGHGEELHEQKYGYCEVRGCKCVIFMSSDSEFDDDDDGIEPLNFDHEDDGA